MNLLKISLAAASVVAVSAVNAATFATSDSNVGSYSDPSFLGITHNFTVGSLGAGQYLSVSSLGIFDSGAAGIVNGDALLVLTSAQGDLLGSVNISGTQGTLVGNYRYLSLGSAIRLDANTSYKLGVFAAGGNNFGLTPPDSAATVGSIFTINSEDNAVTGQLTPGTKYKAGSFEYTVVPEPETYAMVAGLGLVGFGLWRRRQA